MKTTKNRPWNKGFHVAIDMQGDGEYTPLMYCSACSSQDHAQKHLAMVRKWAQEGSTTLRDRILTVSQILSCKVLPCWVDDRGVTVGWREVE